MLDGLIFVGIFVFVAKAFYYILRIILELLRIPIVLITVLILLGAVGVWGIIASTHQSNSSVSGGLVSNATVSDGSYTYFDVWAKNDSWSTKYVAYEVTGQDSRGKTVKSISNKWSPFYGIEAKPGSTTNARVYFDFNDEVGQIKIVSCRLIIGSSANVGYDFDHESISLPCAS